MWTRVICGSLHHYMKPAARAGKYWPQFGHIPEGFNLAGYCCIIMLFQKSCVKINRPLLLPQ